MFSLPVPFLFIDFKRTIILLVGLVDNLFAFIGHVLSADDLLKRYNLTKKSKLTSENLMSILTNPLMQRSLSVPSFFLWFSTVGVTLYDSVFHDSVSFDRS